jgi:hypothetical protein
MRIIQSHIAEYMALIEGLEALADWRLWKDPVECFYLYQHRQSP